MRGFLGGLVLGAVLVAAGAAGLSLLMPIQRPDVATEPPVAVAVGAEGGTGAGMEQPGADADLVEAAPAAPDTEATAPDDLTPMETADTEPAEKPEVGGATAGIEEPEAAPGAPALSMAEEAPVSPQAPAGVPDAPMREVAVPAISDPAQPMAPELPEAGSGFGPAPAMDEAAPEVASEADPEMAAPATAAADDAAPEPEETPAVETEAAPAPEPRMAALPQAGGAEETAPQNPAVGTPVAPLTERDEFVEPAPEGPPAIERFAVPFDNPEGRPLLSILLIDGKNSIGGEALEAFPYPLTFAVDPADPKASEKVARHRAAGFEVVLMANLPAAATPQDAEVALSVWREAVPEAVAILEGTGTGIQGNRELSDHVTAIAKDAGLGLITQANGLNTVQKLAVRAGVPAAVVFRDFDGAGQTPVVMRRFLDQAAFRAGQEGAVIMLGRVQPDTISALLLWGLQDRAQRVALAPVSAVLLGEPGAQ